MTDTYTGNLDVGHPPCTVTCATNDCGSGYDSGCALALHYANSDGMLDMGDVARAVSDGMKEEEVQFLIDIVNTATSLINSICPGCYCSCGSWSNAECTTVGKRRQTRICTPAGCDTESRIINDTSCKSFGDITQVTLDGKILPENGSLKWLVNDDAHVKVFFRNIGNVSSTFHIWLTDETGITITGCDVTTGTIPPGITAYYVDLCIFLPDVVKIKTLTAHIEH